MSGRLKPIADPVRIQFDGEELRAERGEPLVCALVAAGNLALARSPKFHRPRGPACLRAACDGCLARVDERPNIMTCMVAVHDGMQIHTQNTLGSRSVDLLRMTDWFFPEGLNHHELFAGVPGVQTLMQGFARRVAGLGRLPAETAPRRPAARRHVDVVVVGAGPAGMAVAAAAAAKGRKVEVLEDHLAPGGGLNALGASDRRAWEAIERPFRASGVRVRTSTTAGALYGDDLLIVGPEGAEVLTASAIVLAPGAHDGAAAFEGNDVPGVMSARAAGWLLSRGVLVGATVAVVVGDGGGPFGEAYARAVKDLRAACEVVVAHGEPIRASGNSRVTGCVVRERGRERKVKADALLVDVPRAPAYELAEQAGAPLIHAPRGYVPRTDRGKIRDGVFLVGEAAGTPFLPDALAREAEEIVRQLT
jgi:sarcosine oxidase subunit alpha